MATTIQNIELPKKARALDTSGNNNHGQIYSGRALEFDGVSDYLTTGYGSGLNPTTADVTIALWAKPNVTSEDIVAGVDHAGGATRLYVGSYSGFWDIGVQSSPWNNTTTGGVLADRKKLNINTWYRLVLVLSGTTATLYVNGIQSISKTYSSYTFNSGFYIGNQDTDTDHAFDGKISDFQIWDAAFTQADVTYDYLNPESLALNRGGTSLTESNLKLWYPMQDGHRGQQSYILDGANSGLGDDLVSEGDFSGADDGDPWVTGTGWSIEDGEAACDGSQTGNSWLSQSSALVVGSTYEITFNLVVSAGQVLVDSGTTGIRTINTTSGSKTEILTASTTTFQFMANSAFVGSIDNVTVKAINDKNHATTVFYGDELITNGTFETNTTGWSNLSGATFERNTSSPITGSGDMHWVASGTSYTAFKHDAAISVVAGRSYKLEYDYRVVGTDYISAKLATTAAATGSLLSGFTETELNETSNTSVSYTFTSGATDDVYLVFRSGDGGDPEIYVDNISLKEVGVASGWTDADQQLHIPQTALQSYNELAWFDGEADYVAIGDHDDLSFDAFSVSAWINMNDATNFPVISKGAYNSTAEWLFITEGVDKIKLYIMDESVSNCYIGRATAALTSSEGEWLHVVGTYDGGTASSGVKLYVNGVQSDDSNAENTAGSFVAMENLGAAVHIGKYNAHYANGSITETSLWDEELSSTEVQELYNDGKALDALTHSQVANLTGYWRNNGLSTWTDLSTNSNNGTVTGTETILIPQGVDSTRDNQGFIMNRQKDTSCLNLTNTAKGPRTYVDLGSTTTIADDAAASFIMWVKPDDFADHRFLTNGTGDRWRFQSSTIIECNADSTDMNFTVSTMTAGEWIHVALVRAADDDWYVYTNGNASSSNPVSQNKTFDYRYIGGLGPNSDGVRGQIDGFLVYNKELSSTEILRNYNATKGSHRN